MKTGEKQETERSDGGTYLYCPDLAAMMGFCDHCYRDNVRIAWPYLTCYCECNGVGVFAALTVSGGNGREAIHIGSWKMKMEKSREEFEVKLTGLDREQAPAIDIRFV